MPLALQRTISRYLTPSTSLERNVQRHVTLSSFQSYVNIIYETSCVVEMSLTLHGVVHFVLEMYKELDNVR